MAVFLDVPVRVTVTTAATWTDVDVSAYVPAGATGVIIDFNKNNTSSSTCRYGFRKNGSTDDRPRYNYENSSTHWNVGIDSSRVFEMYLGTVNTAAESRTTCWVVGYYTDDAAFVTNGVDKTITIAATWTDISLTAEITGNAIAAFFEESVPATSGGTDYGFRANGSTDNRVADSGYYGTNGAVVGLASNICEKYQQKIGTISGNFTYYKGCIYDGLQMNTNGVDISPANYAGYTIATIHEHAIGALLEVFDADMSAISYYGAWPYAADSSKATVESITVTSVSTIDNYLLLEYSPILMKGTRVRISSTISVPTPLSENVTYYSTDYTNHGEIRLTNTLNSAIASDLEINITYTGSGTLTLFLKDYSHYHNRSPAYLIRGTNTSGQLEMFAYHAMSAQSTYKMGYFTEYPVANPVFDHTQLGFLIMSDIDTYTALGTATTSTNLNITDVDLEEGEMIVNVTRSTLSYPASRIVEAVVDTSNVTIAAITSQTASDTVMTFKWEDKKSILQAGTLRIVKQSDHRNYCEFSLVTTTSYIPKVGQNVKITYEDETLYGGAISSVRLSRAADIGMTSSTSIIAAVTSEGYNHIPSRRSITYSTASATASQIIQNVIDTYLYQEGIRYLSADITTGATLNEYPEFVDQCISCKQVFDDMAEASGMMWWIDDDRYFHFGDGGTPTSSWYTLDDSGTFTNYNNVVVESTMVDYGNKQFCEGGTDELHAEDIVVWYQNSSQITLRQQEAGNTGIYGYITTAPDVEQVTEQTAETGTTTINLTLINHGLVVGDMIVNRTRASAHRTVVAVVDTSNVTLDSSVASQTTGDTINWYPDANFIVRTNLKRYGTALPKVLEFDTTSVGNWTAGEKLYVNLACFGAATTAAYYFIEQVEMTDLDGINMNVHITATLRDNSDFSGMYSRNWYDTWQKLNDVG